MNIDRKVLVLASFPAIMLGGCNFNEDFCIREGELVAWWKSHSTLTLLATQNYPFLLKYDCPLWLK